MAADWQPDPEEQRQAVRSADRAGLFQSHTAFSGVSFLRRRADAPFCILHPQEARARDLCDGQRVRLFNDRGSVGLVLKASDEVQPGNVPCARTAPRKRDGLRDDQRVVLRLLHRYRRGGHLPEHLAQCHRLAERLIGRRSSAQERAARWRRRIRPKPRSAEPRRTRLAGSGAGNSWPRISPPPKLTVWMLK